MSDKDTGGPAFPCDRISCGSENAVFSGHGMTIRDYFAAKAMQGVLSNPNCPMQISDDVLATQAYDLADAMLKERVK